MEVFFKNYVTSEKYSFSIWKHFHQFPLKTISCTLVSPDCCELSRWNTDCTSSRCLIYTSGLKFKTQFWMYAFYSSPHIWKSHLKLKHPPPTPPTPAHVHWPGHWSSAHVGAAPIPASAFCILRPPPFPPSNLRNSLGGMFLFTGKELLTESEPLFKRLLRADDAFPSAHCWVRWPYEDFINWHVQRTNTHILALLFLWGGAFPSLTLIITANPLTPSLTLTRT